MTVIRYICALSNKIMAVFYKGVKYVAGFLNKQPVSGYLRGYQVFPDAVTILGAELLLYDLPEGYTGYTKLEYIPACGGKTKQCIVRYKYKDAYNKDIFGDITVDYLEGEQNNPELISRDILELAKKKCNGKVLDDMTIVVSKLYSC